MAYAKIVTPTVLEVSYIRESTKTWNADLAQKRVSIVVVLTVAAVDVVKAEVDEATVADSSGRIGTTAEIILALGRL